MRQTNVSLDTGDEVAAMLVPAVAIELDGRAGRDGQATLRRCRTARAVKNRRRPGLSEVDVCYELTRRRYGAVLADAAFADRLPDG